MRRSDVVPPKGDPKTMHSKATQIPSAARRLSFLALSFSALLGIIIQSSAITLLTPVVRSNFVSFSIDSVPDQLLTVQQSQSLSDGWSDAAYYRGTGTPITFSAPATNTWRFFRVRTKPFEPLALVPSGPNLVSGEVSLPDAVVGESYSQQIAPGLSGFPPYALSVSGTPPAGVSLAITNNESGHAVLQVLSTGLELAAGQRAQFGVTVQDSLNMARTQEYDLRVIAPSPTLALNRLTLKAGDVINTRLSASGGSGTLSWSVIDGALPDGVSLSPDGLLTGTPTTDAAERNEDGKYTNIIEVADSFTDRITGLSAPRKATVKMQTLVRLSYVLNIQATRDGGPSLRQSCVVCHGPDFKPDITAGASALLTDKSGSGAECGTDRNYVVPGDASDSLLYEKVIDPPECGERMPFAGPYFSDQQVGRLVRWIRELTPADTD